jgi:dTDP-4-amino-4,6-dideoxygalactose transaminase
MIVFTKPAIASNEHQYLRDASMNGAPWGGGKFTHLATGLLQSHFDNQNVLLTQSCTSALELAALALDIQVGDEVIVPSYTFVSSASAFALRGARLVFAEIDKKTLNIDVNLIESLITEKTKAIVAVHYGGQSALINDIMALAAPRGIAVVEDAAQAIGSTSGGLPVGTIGDLACFSFHGTKNLSSGEGGALVINTKDSSVIERALLAHEKGTNRRSYLNGEVDKYTWQALGSSFIPSEFTASVLAAQLEDLDLITSRRITYWDEYSQLLAGHQDRGFDIVMQDAPGNNGHMFALILKNPEPRGEIIKEMRAMGVQATSHYEPLHNSPYISSTLDSQKGCLPVTEFTGRAILRMPMWSADGLDTETAASAFLSSLSKARSSR